MSDCYDDMSTADLLREVCRKLDRIEKQGAPVVVHNAKVVTDFDGTRPGKTLRHIAGNL